MSRLAAMFAQLQQKNRAALIPFITAGDPSLTATVPLMHALVESGADAIELGMPFSDPMADGPSIQRASERALGRGVKLRMVLEWVREFRRSNQQTPVILMGYLNPLEAMGMATFAELAAGAGVDGVIIVDLTPEEGREESALLKACGVDPIFLLAPTSGAARVQTVRELGSGFVYYVSLRGITGAAQSDWPEVLKRVGELRRELALPVAIGFGIRDAETVTRVAQGADAVVVGSALVEQLADCSNDQAAVQVAKNFIQALAGAVQKPRSVQ
ncbi:tryptophan synthase subunit alpha [Acidithiobacillus thiooxidans]|jgi:tryptophan synthase alpha chain|uniref:tryptophan synthase subunit alpha n=1 Tax=Acidithiobacillus TaxID=119977 RepID=UPI0002625501|nr:MULTISPECIES: tryptophan synthase subunit alpha [Acidithiobacillus]MBU2752678.1 tryptophan synthase subunit alpha [Acidithiobacillus thiooxidans]MBU2811439.1 tryptophan synthase subunit alpha [Acidithiobacillus thiooxidans]MBU2835766.1 tryptophan synthase subunit alpha [Acidithiobacillus thiooxidans]MBU2838846.1 tryptophan synthase subunit alpha [Acidithiobacillus thiooxidans]MDA8176593.1 tryptophan synthase subunit alpha [Acidithiobacillus sp.]